MLRFPSVLMRAGWGPGRQFLREIAAHIAESAARPYERDETGADLPARRVSSCSTREPKRLNRMDFYNVKA
jgi:hypothetical protein